MVNMARHFSRLGRPLGFCVRKQVEEKMDRRNVKKLLRRKDVYTRAIKTDADLKGWEIGCLDLLKQLKDRWEEGYKD